MFERTKDADIDIALREGLRSVHAPVAGPDFDARVLAALERPLPWWQSLRSTLKPALGGATFSLIATLCIVNWALREPDRGATGHNSGIATVSIEKALESPNLTSASLTRLHSIRSAATIIDPETQSAIRNPQSAIPQSKIRDPQLPRPGQTQAPASRSTSLV